MKQTPLFKPNGIYHIFNHANGKGNVFEEHKNYFYFLKEYAEKLDGVVTTLAYCLMPNHFHLQIKVKEPSKLFVFLDQKKKKKKKVFVPPGLTDEEL